MSVTELSDTASRFIGAHDIPWKPNGALVLSFFITPNKFLEGNLAGRELK